LAAKTTKMGCDNNYDHAILTLWSNDNYWTKILYV